MNYPVPLCINHSVDKNTEYAAYLRHVCYPTMPPAVRAFGRDLSVRQASVWILEALQSVFALVIVGITGSAANGFKHDLHANGYPAKLHYNIALVRSRGRSLLSRD